MTDQNGQTGGQQSGKPMSLEDLAKQSPIFSDSELNEDDFDPWAPLDDSKKDDIEEAHIVKDAEVTQTTQKETAEKLNEIIPEDEDIHSDELSTEENEDIDSSSFQNFLNDLHIDWGKIIGCIGAFALAIVVIVAGIYGGKFVVNYFENRPQKIEMPTEEITKTDEDNKQQSENQTWVDVSIEAGKHAGSDSLKPDKEVIKEAKRITKSPEDIDYYLTLLSKIQTTYETDLFMMMNESRNRQKSYDGYLNTMKSLSDKVHSNLPELQTRQAMLEEVFNDLARRKDTVEENYFNALDVKNGEIAGDSLKEFIALSQQSVDIRARFRALDNITKRMGKYVSALDNRIKAVELNREAIVKGVRVIEVDNADLGLVVNEKDL